MHTRRTGTYNDSCQIFLVDGIDDFCLACFRAHILIVLCMNNTWLLHQFVTYVQNGNIEALAQSKSLWKCLSCFACVERCPRDVKPGKLIDAARQLVVRERGQNYLEADEIPELIDEETPQQLLVSAFRRYRR